MKQIGILLTVILLAAACAGPRTAVRGAREVPEDVKARVLKELRERNEGLRSLKGLASVRYGVGVFGGRGEAAFVVEAPDRARIDVLTDFGVAQSQLSLNRRRLMVLWPSQARYFDGEADAESLARYAGVGLDPEALIGILLGKVPLGDKAEDSSRRVYATGGGMFLVTGDGLEIRARESDGAVFPESYKILSDAGRPVYQVALDSYSKEGHPVTFPDRLAAKLWKEGASQTKARIDVEYRDVQINPRIDGKVFELKIPDEAQPVSHP